ncbi:MAG: hypothetical protein WBX38_17200 [Candidatus Sulfotelmatobacter sp.]
MTYKPPHALPFFFLCFLSGLAVFGQTSAPDVSISGSLSAHAIREDELLQFTLTIKDKADPRNSPQPNLWNLTLQKIPDGYSLAPEQKICVLPAEPKLESCQTTAGFDPNKGLKFAASLASGQSLTVEGYLKPTSPHKAAALNTVVAWTVLGGVASSQSVSLGDNQVQKTSQTALTWFGDLVKLLAIPIVLALIGYGLNLLNRKHDERVADAQEKRQDAQHEHELQQAATQHSNDVDQAVRSETWKQMLLISHGYAAKCYLPLSLAASRLAANLRSLTTPDGDERIAFFYVLLCGKEMMNTRQETGGFYFKDLRGETLAAECWRKQRDQLIGEKEESSFSLAIRNAIELVSCGQTYAAFKRRFESVNAQPVSFHHADIQAAWLLFKNWLANAQAVIDVAGYLEGFSAVLDYESNRPYEYWYPTKPQLAASDETVTMLEGILADNGFSKAEIDKYFETRKKP